MKRLGVIANCLKPHARPALERLAKHAARLDLALVAADCTADLLPGAERVESEAFAKHIDWLIALGGDGTLLRAVRSIQFAEIPIIGVNLGSLGFLTSVTEEHLDTALEALVSGNYSLSIRTAIDCELLRDEQVMGRYSALNDVVLGWGTSSRVIVLELFINDEAVTAYMCDGLIVATPTGSTGHSLSAFGPIVHPESRVLLINVICPHSLSARPMVIPDDAVIRLRAADMSDHKRLRLSVDGQSHDLFEKGDELRLHKHAASLRFIHLPGYSYSGVLRQKLHWRGMNV